MKSHKVRLTEEKATMLITLYARALDSRSRHSILSDEKASEIVNAIDYDFEKLKGLGNGSVMVARARQIDEWLTEFLKSAPNAVVLNLGCGLDTRICRIGPPSNISWFDVDYPEVIKERQNFFSNREGYLMVESSISDSEWLAHIPSGRPAIVIADGVMEYLEKDQVRALLNRVVDHFPRGQVVFDVMNSYAIKSGRQSLKATTGAEHRWAVDDIQSVDQLNPKLRRISNLSVLRSRYLPLTYRVIFGMGTILPSVRNMIRLLRYEF